jgi:hypothetical protein
MIKKTTLHIYYSQTAATMNMTLLIWAGIRMMGREHSPQFEEMADQFGLKKT